MQEIIALAVPVLFIFLFIKVLMTPMKLIFKLLLNTGCGFVCLFLLNLLSGFTGIVFELNFITAAIVGFLGLPGIILLLVFQSTAFSISPGQGSHFVWIYTQLLICCFSSISLCDLFCSGVMTFKTSRPADTHSITPSTLGKAF